MVVIGLIVVAVGSLVLSSCAAELGHANPEHRLPGRLPEVRHPTGYMPLGMLGLVLVIGGAMLLCGSSNAAAAWLLAVTAIGVALGGPMIHHNRRLPR